MLYISIVVGLFGFNQSIGALLRPRGGKYSAVGATIVSSGKHSLTGEFDLKFHPLAAHHLG